MNSVLNNKDLFNIIKSYVCYSDTQIKKFKASHYFFYQHQLNEEIRWVGFILRDDVNLWDCYECDDKIIHTHILF
tara:strand:+ start:1016 stop:1240 length:225 start_codon:yes stop_codon:yes gene_type:complete